jgi:ubiquinone biosynthesis protein
VLGLLRALCRLPRRLGRITTSLERGTLTTSVRLLADDRDRRFVARMAGRAVLAFLGAASGVDSVMLIGARGSPLLARPRRAPAAPRCSTCSATPACSSAWS